MKIFNIFKITVGGSSASHDPVCGMSVSLENTKYSLVWRGKKYAFCSPGCKEEFDKTPARYA